jgi:4-amino-4-deoxy-L-arabinose transferase-like glycosyltransferase
MVAGHLREGLNRLPPVLLLAAFCLPLFFGLDRTDLENDEAIYAYAVESILVTGEWLSPRISPSADTVFLEKPPLKFWIVAAPIQLGLLPLDEVGLRLWDAVFGGIAFVYVFLIGRRLAGWICGAMALLVLFGHEPLLFIHGLRSHNMEAALFLCYCGGVYHYLALMDAADGRARARHIAAITALFCLGFLTKFVAALFLPMVLAAAAVLLPAHRRRLAADWRRWRLAGLLAAAVIVPWFAYQSVQEGAGFWRVIVGEHVYARFTDSVDPAHRMPWDFYLSSAWFQLARSGSAWWAAFGLIVLAGQTLRRRRAEELVVLLWLVLPLCLISLGTSKLYHYFYPYLPPIALAAGYGLAWLVTLFAGAAARRRETVAGWFSAQRARWPSRVTLGGSRPARWQPLFAALMAVALALAVLALIEPVRVTLGGQTLFRNHSVPRPLLAAVLFAWLAGFGRLAAVVIAALIISFLVPTPVEGYRANLGRLAQTSHPLRTLGECVRDVEASKRARGDAVLEPYTPVRDGFLHSYFYYLRGSGWFEQLDDERLRDAAFTPGRERPVIVEATDYVAFLSRAGAHDPMPEGFSQPGLVILLPGEYARCRSAAAEWAR